jgi:choice-of-anchor B domain-containing protein
LASRCTASPAAAVPQLAAADPDGPTAEDVAMAADTLPPETVILHHTECVDGFAGPYPCLNVDLLSVTPLSELGGGGGTDIWGWTDPDTGKEYAIVPRTDGTAFVDVSDPEEAVYLGNLPSHSGDAVQRDAKTYDHYALIVSEASGHGLQVFDLHELRSVVSPPVTFTETAHYSRFTRAHNIAVDEASGFAYAVGSREGADQCDHGLHMIDLSDPLAPSFAGCYSEDGYTHDVQCVVYAGPDFEHQGSQVCFAANEDTLTIVDVTDKASPVQLSRTGYGGVGYTHQGWLTEDHRWFLLDDELDESFFGHNTRTRVFDVADLDQPVLAGHHDGVTGSSDHNLYVRGDLVYEANYRSGLRILRIGDLASAELTEVGFFDVYPADDGVSFNGAWSSYPWFASGNVIVSGREQGLFVLRPVLCSAPAAPADLTAIAGGDQRIDLAWSASPEGGTVYTVERALGGCAAGPFETLASGLATPGYVDQPVSGQVVWGYRVAGTDPTGLCRSEPTPCEEVSTTGPCTAPPLFAGLETVTNPAGASCRLELAWSPAVPSCGVAASYNVYRDTDLDLVPSPANRIATAVAGTAFADLSALGQVGYTYLVRAVDSGSAAEDPNLVELRGTASGPPADGTWAAGAELGDPELSSGAPGPMRRPGFAGAPGGAQPIVLHQGWEIDPEQAHGGLRSYYSDYSDNQCSSLTTPSIDLPAGEAAQLAFWTRFDIEASFDGGVVEISDDGGGSWELLTPAGGYPGSFNNSGDACGYASGHPSYTGQQTGWVEQTFDLSAFAGSTVQVRWVFSTDQGLTLGGWWIDDLAIGHAQVPGPCTSTVFADGFESGGLGAWSAATP